MPLQKEFITTKPAAQATVNKTDVSNTWSVSTKAQAKGLYALAIVPKNGTANPNASLGDIAGSVEYVFSVNPKVIEMDEPSAVTITPTQDGSNFIEHQGGIYKTISISGTTGLRPNNTGVVFKDGEQTGMHEFMNLRNIIRNYQDVKKDPALSAKFEMVWQNGKEGEFWVVEPLSFKTKRDAANNRVTFDYDLQLRTLRKIEFKHWQRPSETDTHKELNSIARFNARMAENSRNLSGALNTLNTNLNKVTIATQKTLTSIISNGTDVLTAVSNVITSGSRVFSIPRNTLWQLANSARAFFQSMQDLNGELNAYRQLGIVTSGIVVGHSAKMLANTYTSLFCEESLFKEVDTTVLSRRIEPYRNPVLNNKIGNATKNNLEVANIVPSSSKSVSVVMDHDNIYSLAYRLLGDSGRWKELVLVNNLKPPYVDPTGDGKTVLRPMSPILYPSSAVSTTTAIAPDLTIQDPLVSRLGRDIRVTSNTALGGTVLYDLSVSNSGDLDITEGVPNLEQSIELRFATEQGSLPLHPTYGIAASIGSKATVRTIVGQQLNIRSSLLSDARISSIDSLNINLEGNVLSVKSKISVADVNQSVSVNFDTRQ